MNKLRVKRIIEKVKGQSFYRVTELGWKYLWLSICSERYFKNPMISRATKNEALRCAEQPSRIEGAYGLIDRGLTQISQELAIAT